MPDTGEPTVRAWRTIGASVTGSAHTAADRPCEDASASAVFGDRACLVVADGAGSRPRAREGSACAVEAALEFARRMPTAPDGPEGPLAWLRELFLVVQERLVAEAEAAAVDVDEFGTTLGVAVLTPHGLYLGQVGDTIAVVRSAGEFRLVDPAPRYEYANDTEFLTSQDAIDLARFSECRDVDAVFLATDGLRYKILDLKNEAPFIPFFEDLVGYALRPDATDAVLAEFLLGLDDQTGDDKTLHAAVRDG